MHAFGWHRNPSNRNNVDSTCPCLIFCSYVIPVFDPGTLFREWGQGLFAMVLNVPGGVLPGGFPVARNPLRQGPKSNRSSPLPRGVAKVKNRNFALIIDTLPVSVARQN
jgi:hypothetical protein